MAGCGRRFEADGSPPPLPPTVDVREDADGSALLRAFQCYGIAYLTGYGDAMAMASARARRAAERLFALPLEEKQRVHVGRAGRGDESTIRGYIGVGGESGGASFERKEGISYGARSNAFPPALPDGDALALTELFDACNELACELVQRLAGALIRATQQGRQRPGEGDTEEAWRQSAAEGARHLNTMRLFHYLPPSPPPPSHDQQSDGEGRGRRDYGHGHGHGHDDESELGSSPHTDWGLLTLIVQYESDPTALQWLPEGPQRASSPAADAAWRDIPPRAATLVCNAGDMFALLTDGAIKSPVHRVRALHGHEASPSSPLPHRYSFVHFAYPRASTPVAVAAHVASRSGDAEWRARLSLLQDQSEARAPDNGADAPRQQQRRRRDGREAGDAEEHEPVTVPFGVLLHRKWQQVQRNVAPPFSSSSSSSPVAGGHAAPPEM